MKERRKEQEKHPPVIGFAGWSGSGKTTLIVDLIPAIREAASENGTKKLRIAVIKHDAHGITLTPVSDPVIGTDTDMYIDTEGKDSWKFRKAGADSVILCGPEEIFISADKDITEERVESFLKEPADPSEQIYMKRVTFSKLRGKSMLDAAIRMACDCDLILVEGFKNDSLPQVGIARKENGKGLTADPGRFLAVVTDDPGTAEKCSKPDTEQDIPVFRPDQYRELAAFLLKGMRENNL